VVPKPPATVMLGNSPFSR